MIENNENSFEKCSKNSKKKSKAIENYKKENEFLMKVFIRIRPLNAKEKANKIKSKKLKIIETQQNKVFFI